MNQHAANPKASESPVEAKAVTEKGTEVFRGFEPLKSNYVYCPNQFFDICLKSNSRGMVRIVAYILRQTLGWLDENGQPINQTVRVTYRDLIQKAGVSRGAIGKALKLAVASGFLDCCVAAKTNKQSQSSQTAEYTLRWDRNVDYATAFSNFEGFFTGEGHRTPVPNSFFDVLIPNEQLAVTKVVGAVIRHTIGYQNQFGGRRTTAPLSYTQIQNQSALSDRSTLAAAIRYAVATGYISQIAAGTFTHDRLRQSAATYGVRWLAAAANNTSGSKNRPEKEGIEQRFKNQTNSGSEIRPEKRFKNQTSIEITISKDILKQQAAVDLDSKTKQRLMAAGFDETTAKKLLAKRGVAAANDQLDWIDARNPKNRLAMLRKAIEENWTEPASFAAKQKLAATRQREAIHNAAQLSEEGIVNQQKAERLKRKKRLLAQWQSATQSQRAAWISLAAKRQAAKSLQQIIARQSPSTEKPHAQVLDQVAISTALPALTLESSAVQDASVSEQLKSPSAQAAIDSKSNTADTPQKEKTPTELASF